MNQYSLADAMTDKYVCVYFTKVSLFPFVSTVIWPKMLSLAITLLLLLVS